MLTPPTPSTASASEPTYFSQFSTFTPDVDASFLTQFNALALNQGWTKKQKTRHRAEAIQTEFDHVYGTDTTKLETWQALCREVGVSVVPGSITKCKKVCLRLPLYEYPQSGTGNSADVCCDTGPRLPQSHGQPRQLDRPSPPGYAASPLQEH